MFCKNMLLLLALSTVYCCKYDLEILENFSEILVKLSYFSEIFAMVMVYIVKEYCHFLSCFVFISYIYLYPNFIVNGWTSCCCAMLDEKYCGGSLKHSCKYILDRFGTLVIPQLRSSILNFSLSL